MAKMIRIQHVCEFEMMIGAEEDAIREPETLGSGSLHVYAECKCGRELDKDEIESIVNRSEAIRLVQEYLGG
jgi:hypothetical protein